jgi:hypothetical protein
MRRRIGGCGLMRRRIGGCGLMMLELRSVHDGRLARRNGISKVADPADRCGELRSLKRRICRMVVGLEMIPKDVLGLPAVACPWKSSGRWWLRGRL